MTLSKHRRPTARIEALRVSPRLVSGLLAVLLFAVLTLLMTSCFAGDATPNRGRDILETLARLEGASSAQTLEFTPVVEAVVAPLTEPAFRLSLSGPVDVLAALAAAFVLHLITFNMGALSWKRAHAELESCYKALCHARSDGLDIKDEHIAELQDEVKWLRAYCAGEYELPSAPFPDLGKPIFGTAHSAAVVQA